MKLSKYFSWFSIILDNTALDASSLDYFLKLWVYILIYFLKIHLYSKA